MMKIILRVMNNDSLWQIKSKTTVDTINCNIDATLTGQLNTYNLHNIHIISIYNIHIMYVYDIYYIVINSIYYIIIHYSKHYKYKYLFSSSIIHHMYNIDI
jgi:hypothetical protein